MASECLLDIRSIGYGLAVGMVGGEVRTVVNEGQYAGILTLGKLVTASVFRHRPHSASIAVSVTFI